MPRIDTAAQLSAHLRALRKARGFTQTQVGDLLGVTAARISEIERNASAVSFEQILRLIHALGARLDIEPRRDVVRETANRGEW